VQQVARAAIDSAEMRRRNLIGAAEMPYKLPRLEPSGPAADTECDSGDYGEALAPSARVLALAVRLPPARVSTAHMVKASYIAIAIGTTPISTLWRRFTDRAKAMDSTRSPWRCAG
jgi:hypothetical protein